MTLNEFMALMNSIHARHSLASDYEKSVALLKALKAGQVSLDQVIITGDTWQIVAVEEPKPQPETQG